MKPIVEIMLFAKRSELVNYACQGLKYLAYISPCVLLPFILEITEPALQSLSESHRTLSSISALDAVAPGMFKSTFPQGSKHLVSLLHLALPGIDINDLKKSITTLFFILTTVSNITIHDCSQSPAILDNDDLEQTRLSTSGFVSWIPQYISRIFTIFENLPHNFGIGDNQSSEEQFIYNILYTSQMVFAQLSPEMEDLAISVIFKRIANSNIPSATAAVGGLCGLLCRSNPQKRLATFFEYCTTNIKQEIENGAASTPTSNVSNNQNPFNFARMSDAPFYWYLNILKNIVSYAGKSLLAYSTEIVEILELLFVHCKSWRAYTWTGELLLSICQSLTFIYPLEFNSHPESVINQPDFYNQSYKYWGSSYKIPQLESKWHIPSQAEVQFATQLSDKYITICIENIRILGKGDYGNRLDLLRFLNILKYGIQCTFCFLQPEGFSDADMDDIVDDTSEITMDTAVHTIIDNTTGASSKNDTVENRMYNNTTDDIKNKLINDDDIYDIFRNQQSNIPLDCGFLFSKKSREYKQWKYKLKEIRQTTIELGINLMESDDVELIQSLISLIRNQLTNQTTQVQDIKILYKFSKKMIGSNKDSSLIPRSLYIRNLNILHLMRVQHNYNIVEYDNQTKQLVEILNKFSLGKYSQVRINAQTTLCKTSRFTTQTLTFLVRNHVDDQLKGTLHLMKSLPIYSNWKFAHDFISKLLNFQTDNIKTLNLIEAFVYQFKKKSNLKIVDIKKHTTEHFDHVINQKLFKAEIPPKSLLENENLPENYQKSHSEKQEKILEMSLESYRETIKLLIEYLKNETHNWRFCKISLDLLATLLNEEFPLGKETAEIAFKYCIHDHPEIRESSLLLLNKMFDLLRIRALKNNTNYTEQLKKEININDLPNSEHGILDFDDRDFYIDKSLSYLIPPTKIQYKTGSVDIPYDDSESKDCLVSIKQRVMDKDFWLKFCHFFALVSSNNFDHLVADVYKRIFHYTQTDCLDLLIPIIECIIKDEGDGSQKFCSEIISGIIRGAKYWSKDKITILENRIFPILESAIDSATSESIIRWGECVYYFCTKRDPARYYRIIRKILDSKLDITNESFFTESKKIVLLNGLFSIYSVKLANSAQFVIEKLLNLAGSPYQKVRKSLGQCLATCIGITYKHNYSDLNDFFLKLNKDFNFEKDDRFIELFKDLQNLKDLPFQIGSNSLYANKCKSCNLRSKV
jgi:hypothetical protein